MIQELITWGAGGGIGILAVVSGSLVAKKKPKQEFPTCSCHHELAFHDLQNNTCHFEVRRIHYRDASYKHSQGERIGKQWVQCPCRKYTGPRPSDELYDPGLVWPPS